MRWYIFFSTVMSRQNHHIPWRDCISSSVSVAKQNMAMKNTNKDYDDAGFVRTERNMTLKSDVTQYYQVLNWLHASAYEKTTMF